MNILFITNTPHHRTFGFVNTIRRAQRLSPVIDSKSNISSVQDQLPSQGAASLDQRGLRRSRGPSQTESYRGSVNPIGPRACYDEGKRAAETLFMDYHRMNKVNIRVVRIFNTYGPRMHPFDGRVVSNFIRQALRGEDLTIFGDGSQTRSFCYRDDLVEGILRMMQAPDDFIGPVNLGNPEEFTIRELAQQVLELTGSKSNSSRAHCRPTIRPSAGPTSRWPRSGCIGSRPSNCGPA